MMKKIVILLIIAMVLVSCNQEPKTSQINVKGTQVALADDKPSCCPSQQQKATSQDLTAVAVNDTDSQEFCSYSKSSCSDSNKTKQVDATFAKVASKDASQCASKNASQCEGKDASQCATKVAAQCADKDAAQCSKAAKKSTCNSAKKVSAEKDSDCSSCPSQAKLTQEEISQ